MMNDIKIDAEMRMKKCVEAFEDYINKIRTGRASPNVLNDIQVKYYGVLSPLRQLANIIVEDSCTLIINAFDHKVIPMIMKAIINSDLGFNPLSDGAIIRITLPPLTEERRRYLIKVVRVEAEKGKISLRNIRRLSNDKIKFLLKNKIISLDEEHVLQGEIQKLTDLWVKKMDIILEKKELELMNV
ncbi:ribosome recycling factor [Blochmannia endosymbiont of Camponotus (Colobopsis) obliquus]|uniref:ribosome recycling factor n=1 Tax=Blochmannia endosymbiont of Camponotus (Colobopsis) obliquus TaxID=1505597 RepID=UPI00061A6C69|nr:ribosome recycling factor [Blochmannia endosymbiont of Camponotus (Colobopsis) obliquus]AKC60440.1 ribosome recycling factor [Blochmannia endosymbiont of Camponotus (Colobopsis) obliquus]